MTYMKTIVDHEIAVERRMEKSYERNGFIASAHVSFDVDCQLEKFGREEVRVNVKVPFDVRKVA